MDKSWKAEKDYRPSSPHFLATPQLTVVFFIVKQIIYFYLFYFVHFLISLLSFSKEGLFPLTEQ